MIVIAKKLEIAILLGLERDQLMYWSQSRSRWLLRIEHELEGHLIQLEFPSH
jgi:hypothetical protein